MSVSCFLNHIKKSKLEGSGGLLRANTPTAFQLPIAVDKPPQFLVASDTNHMLFCWRVWNWGKALWGWDSSPRLGIRGGFKVMSRRTRRLARSPSQHSGWVPSDGALKQLALHGPCSLVLCVLCTRSLQHGNSRVARRVTLASGSMEYVLGVCRAGRRLNGIYELAFEVTQLHCLGQPRSL